MARHVHSSNMRRTKLLISVVQWVELWVQCALKLCFGNFYDAEDDVL